MPKITITEALAEIKLIEKKIDSKHKTISTYLMRPATLKDPLEKPDGTNSAKIVAQERQGVIDLEKRLLTIRCAIHDSNNLTNVTIGNTTHTIAEWIVWKREIYPIENQWLQDTTKAINAARYAVQQKGGKLAAEEEASTIDIVINLDEATLHKQIEDLMEQYETLDGQLSLKNATVIIDV